MFILFIMPETIKDASLEGITNIKGTVKVANGTRVSGLHKSHVGLDKVDNTSDYLKPVSYYTELHVKAKIADLIGGAPETLDTLKEIATAIGSNPVPADLGTIKANIASPTFTGVPTAPTALANTNTDQIATTKFVASGLALKADASALELKAPKAAPTFTGQVEFNDTNGTSDGKANFNVPLHIKRPLFYRMGTDILTNSTNGVLGSELAQIYLIKNPPGDDGFTITLPNTANNAYMGSVIHFRRFDTSNGNRKLITVKVGTGANPRNVCMYESSVSVDASGDDVIMLELSQTSTTFMCGGSTWFQMQTM